VVDVFAVEGRCRLTLFYLIGYLKAQESIERYFPCFIIYININRRLDPAQAVSTGGITLRGEWKIDR
jgi:hypothetical protein